MDLYRFDENDRLRQLKRLSSRSQIAFALMCATRLLPQYRLFYGKTRRGDPQAIEDLAAGLWDHLLKLQMSMEDLEQSIDSCMELIPTEDDGWDELTQPYAEDAAAALAYAYRAAVSGDAQEAVWASRRSYEAMDHFAGRNVCGSSDDEGARLQHPVVQAELSRQARDLAELRQLDEAMHPQSLAAFRRRAEEEEVSLL